MFKKITSTIILSVIVFSLLVLPVRASVLNSVTKFTSCSGSGVAGAYASAELSILLNKGLEKLKGLGLKFITKLAEDVPVNDSTAIAQYKSKEFALDTIARCAGREILNKMISQVLSVVRGGGRNGGPAFVRNWRNFQADAQYRGENVFRAILSNTKLCDYIDKDIKGVFGVINKISLPPNIQTRIGNLDPYQLRASCTMPSNFNLANYQKDFAGNGGWAAFSRLLEPQNNFYGSLFGALGEVAKQRNLEETADANEAIAGQGFTSTRGKSASDSCEIKDSNGKCLAYKEIKTPGSILRTGAEATINQELGWIANVDELNEVIASAVDILLNRMLDLSDPNEGNYIIPGEIEIDPNTLPTPEPGPGSGLSCEEKGMTNLYEGDVTSAIATVVNTTTLEEGSRASDEDLGLFLDAVVIQLRAGGLKAGRVDNGRLRNDTVIVGREGDPDGTVYDVVTGAGAPGRIGDFLGVSCVDHGPWSWLVNPTTGPPPQKTPSPVSVVTLCQAIGYTPNEDAGLCEEFNASDSDLSNNSIGNDTASSIFIPQGGQAVLCPDAGGSTNQTCETFNSSDTDLRNNLIGNDTASSIYINNNPPPPPPTGTWTLSHTVTPVSNGLYDYQVNVSAYHEPFGPSGQLEVWIEDISDPKTVCNYRPCTKSASFSKNSGAAYPGPGTYRYYARYVFEGPNGLTYEQSPVQTFTIP
ncbi:MAG TPA: hypothetical protein VJC06_00015 [Candidatus Paceibacterota bacterium]